MELFDMIATECFFELISQLRFLSVEMLTYSTIMVILRTSSLVCSVILPQYDWNKNEMFLFRATIAFAMRKYMNTEAFQYVTLGPSQPMHAIYFSLYIL